MAGDPPIIYINGYKFTDVTNHTSCNPIMSYREAIAWTNGKIISCGTYNKRKNSIK